MTTKRTNDNPLTAIEVSELEDSIEFSHDEELLHLLEWFSTSRKQKEGISLLEFMERVSPKFFETYGALPQHLVPIVQLFERCKTERVFACISVPPRHGKTFVAMHALVWFLTHSPDLMNCYVSYGDDLSSSKSRAMMELAREAGLTLDRQAAKIAQWELAETNGGMICTSIGGVLTGKGISGLCVIDDPFKDREAADSQTTCNKVWEWFTNVADTRLEGNSSVIVIHTRWSPNDLIAKLENSEARKWEIISLPALNDKGEALWPAQVSAEELKIKQKQDEFAFAALYQQDPRHRGNTVFRAPTRYDLPRTDSAMLEFLSDKRLLVSIDPAATANTKSDHTAICTLALKGYGPATEAWVVEVRRGKWEMDETAKVGFQMQRKYRCPLIVESVGAFVAIPRMLLQLDPRINLITINSGGLKDKYTRAIPVSCAWNGGKLYVPTAAPWVEDFIKELQNFTGVNDAEDDQVDALAHCWNIGCMSGLELRGAVGISLLH